IGLILNAQPQAANLNYFDCAFLTNCLTDTNLFRRGGPSAFPLYLYPDASSQQRTDGQKADRTVNFNMEILKEIEKKSGMHYRGDDEYDGNTIEVNTFSALDLLDYIYAVLHSPSYREKYKEFLKIDFPRVPYPTHPRTFFDLVDLGSQIRRIHLMETPVVHKFITQYPVDGNNEVGKIRFEENYELIEGDSITMADPAYPFGR